MENELPISSSFRINICTLPLNNSKRSQGKSSNSSYLRSCNVSYLTCQVCQKKGLAGSFNKQNHPRSLLEIVVQSPAIDKRMGPKPSKGVSRLASPKTNISLENRPRAPKGKDRRIVSQPPLFRGELLVSGKVKKKTPCEMGPTGPV